MSSTLDGYTDESGRVLTDSAQSLPMTGSTTVAIVALATVIGGFGWLAYAAAKMLDD